MTESNVIKEKIQSKYVTKIVFDKNEKEDIFNTKFEIDVYDKRKCITNVSSCFLSELKETYNKQVKVYDKVMNEVIPDWWLNIHLVDNLNEYFKQVSKIDWLDVFNKAIDDGYPGVMIRTQPFSMNLGNFTEYLVYRIAYNISCVLDLEKISRVEKVPYAICNNRQFFYASPPGNRTDEGECDGEDETEVTEMFTEDEYNKLETCKNIFIRKHDSYNENSNYNYNIIVMFDKDHENIKLYQHIAFDYNLYYGKDVYISDHLVVSENLSQEFKDFLNNYNKV